MISSMAFWGKLPTSVYAQDNGWQSIQWWQQYCGGGLSLVGYTSSFSDVNL